LVTWAVQGDVLPDTTKYKHSSFHTLVT
jgi:hypothetical protein